MCRNGMKVDELAINHQSHGGHDLHDIPPDSFPRGLSLE